MPAGFHDGVLLGHGLKGCPIVIPRTVLVAPCAFDGTLSAQRVAAAIGRGLQAGGLPEPDLCPIDDGADVRKILGAVDFDARMRRARAVILGERRLEERTLPSSATFEIATRARQAGVPAYAVTSENALDLFDARILDLQVIFEAAGTRALAATGRKLARVI
jgi:glycerate kinase